MSAVPFNQAPGRAHYVCGDRGEYRYLFFFPTFAIVFSSAFVFGFAAS